MNRLTQFDLPIPTIKPSPLSVAIEAFGTYEGRLVLENVGPGELFGRIYANSPALVLPFEEFRGNRIEIDYILNLDGYKKGDRLQWRMVIISNGGEAVIPFDVRVTAPAIVTRDGFAISSLGQFAQYAQDSPIAARQIFTQQNFLMWLFNSGYKYMDIYENFTMDPNKERAVDNFLIINGLKTKVQIKPDFAESDLDISLSLDSEPKAYGLKFRRVGWGYGEANLNVVSGGEWFSLSRTKLVCADFDEDNAAWADFIILPDKISGHHDCAHIDITDDSGHTEQIAVHVRFKRAFEVRPDREVLNAEDRGVIAIINNTGAELKLEVVPSHSWIKFGSKNYIVSGEGRLPFEVKNTAMKGGGFTFRRHMSAEGSITLRAVYENRVYTQIVKLMVR
ncbi:MAG: DUF5717 family protein [Defluviitaleaceae bacterium]|nr:DUF5717 family protein [Defluviitaleaceae bacterium]